MSEQYPGNVKPNVTEKSESLLILTPRETVLDKLKELSGKQLNIGEEKIDNLVKTSPQLLINHSAPVLVPSQSSVEDLEAFVIEHHQTLLDLMLTTWPFPIDFWGLKNVTFESFVTLVDVTYIPIVYFFAKNAVLSAGTNVHLNEGNQALLYFAPTDELIDFLDETIENNREELEDTPYFERLKLLGLTGVAFICNLPKIQTGQSINDYVTLISDPREVVKPVTQDLLKLLFSVYFMNERDWPENFEDQYLAKWFQSKTIAGVYRLSPKSRV